MKIFSRFYSKIIQRFRYWQRIFVVYLTKCQSQVTFWHGIPQINKEAKFDQLGSYYMPFLYKANYSSYFDKNGIPLLDYHGNIGKRHYSLAISQYGLGHYNLYKKTGNKNNLIIAVKQANWLVNNIKRNNKGVWVWMHDIDWLYQGKKLNTPWYSALAQGSGISLLIRIYLETKNKIYLETVQKAFGSFLKTIDEGGVVLIDDKNYYWLEYIVDSPNHILNGFIWALWSIYDYWLLTKDSATKELFDKCVKTLKDNLKDFDTGFWSLYEQSGTKMKMIAGVFYHYLHIIQLKILHKMTGESIFQEYAEKWEKYQHNWFCRNFAIIYKIIFKIFYY